jgi:chemotaxis protein methyltransferase CheR
MRIVANSQFFLDLDLWKVLRQRFLPELLKHRQSLRVWSAGCHVGKEPFSLAILLNEISSDEPHRLLATDFNPDLLEKARAGGPFTEKDVENLTAAERERYLQAGGPPFFVQDGLIRAIEFQQHDLRSDTFEDDFDLILYRDVEPFFTAEENRTIYEKLYAALRPHGLVFVGSVDRMIPPGNGFARMHPSFYLKVGT